MAVDYLSAINKQGSGLNITQIVDSIVQAETAPIASRIQKNIDEKNAVISGYAVVSAELDKMKDYANATKGSTAFSVNSNNSAVEVKVSDQSLANAFDASISVSALATSQTIEFLGFSSKSATINKGSINIDFGSWSGNTFTTNSDKSAQSITINDSNNTLSGLATELSALSGVNATVTDKGDGTFSLIINSDTGAKNALRLSVTEDASDSGLSTFDTTSNNSSKQVVAAQDAAFTVNGVQITRASNTITDLIDGYEFKLNATTSSAASVIASIDADLAYSTVKGFVEVFNSVNSTIDSLTNKGANGTEKGALSRDVVMAGIKRNLRSIITDALPGFEDNPRYISELGIRTERDGSLSLTEDNFRKNFTREPILFDVMVNSLARSSNPSVSVRHPSDILQPKGGVYSFSETGTDAQNTTLGGVALVGSEASGTRSYAAVSGDTAGLRLTSTGSAQNASIYYGESFLSKLSSYIKGVTGPLGTLASSTTDANSTISDFTDEQTNLDEKIAAMTDRYMGQFAAMETAVSGFKKTGEFLTGFIDSMKPKD